MPLMNMTASKHEPSTESRQVIVSGATGFVGRHLVPELLNRGYDVVAIARDEGRARGLAWFGKVRFISLDFHLETLDFSPEAGAALVHLAWPGLPNYRGLFHFEENLPSGYNFVKRLVKAGVSKVLVAGTCFEYGMQNGRLSPSSETRPSNPYGLAKDMLRKQLEALRAESPFVLQWARLFYMYGEGQNPRSVLAQLDAAIACGDTCFNMSGGEQLRDYLPVETVALQLAERLESGSAGTFNVCSGQPVSIRRLVEQRIAEVGARMSLNLGHYPYPDYEPMAFWGEPDAP
jgi:dTDP-6-deoxy-L-talose 4-dehydrogenase (NAD+)